MKFKQKWFNIVFSFIFVFSLLGIQNPQSVSARSVNSSVIKGKQLQNTCLDGGRGIMARADAFTGQTQFIGTRAGEPIRVDMSLKGGSPEDVARGFLTRCGGLFGIRDANNELSVKKQRITEDGQRTTVRFQQEYNGIPVVAGEAFVQLNTQMDVLAAGGEILPRLYVDTIPSTDAGIAAQNALVSVAKEYQLNVENLTVTEPILKIYDAALLESRDGPTLLVWEMEVTQVDALNIRQYVLVNAQRGNVVVSFNKVDTALDLATYNNGNTVTLPPLPSKLKCTEADPECDDVATDADAKGAHIGAKNTYDFYFNQHARDSIDGAGMQIISVVNWFDPIVCPNAFWDGTEMVYCDTLAVADDVVGHELTHGVTEYESGLFYYYQSGAINESLSDIWGEFIDQNSTTGLDTDGVSVDWQIGEDVLALGVLRDMSDPTIYADPDMMSSVNYSEGDLDSGGVHTNSGINNKAAYLMVVGGAFNSIPVTAIGMQKTAAIYYEVQTNLLTSGSDYRDLHDALIQACNNLVGITPPGAGSAISLSDCTNGVTASVEAVEMDEEPSLNFNPEAPVCDSGNQVDLFSDDLEASNYNWNYAGVNNTSNVTDYQRWFKIPDSTYFSYAASGLYAVYGDDYDYDGGNATSDTFVAMRSRVNIPSAMPNAYLHFNHAFGFENTGATYWDGGRIEYSIDGGTTWLDAGTMIDNPAYGYNGVVTTTGPSKNPLKNKTAFVGDSHGYISSRLNISSLIGQNVLFRWRMGTDEVGFDWGWWIDDVEVYSCVGVAPTIITDTFQSVAANDGWILESAETSNKGGTMSSTTPLQVGDGVANGQYRSIVSFDTSSLPDTAVILSVTLKVKQYGNYTGQNPFNTHGDLLADVRTSKFGSGVALQLTDFNANASVTAAGPFDPVAVSKWRTAYVNSAGPFIHLGGVTQFRLRFTMDDNNDFGSDYVRFNAGETVSTAPQLIVEYYVP